MALRFFRTPVEVRLKADRSEVSEADEAAQAAVVATIRAERPSDWIIAEEQLVGGSAPVTRAAVGWVIDPIDGTRNFIRGMPDFSCSVAAMVDGMPVAGAIYLPVAQRLYSAALGRTRAGEAPAATTLPASSASSVSLSAERPGSAGVDEGPDLTGVLYLDGARHATSQALDPIGERSPKLVVAVPSTAVGPAAELMLGCAARHVIRNLGATTLHLAYVATGQYDAALIGDSRLWDIAAGAVLLAAAGGTLETLAGRPQFPLDPAAYAGEALPCLAARSAALAARIRS